MQVGHRSSEAGWQIAREQRFHRADGNATTTPIDTRKHNRLGYKEASRRVHNRPLQQANRVIDVKHSVFF
jgi:hypothetical protein